MPDLKFSDELVENGLIGNTGIGGINDGFKDNESSFHIMKGVIPTQNEFNNAGSNFRAADRLWNDDNIDNIVSLGANTISISFRELAAAVTGTATWFFWEGRVASVANIPTSRIIGSVTIIGGGGDLTMADVNFVNGQSYAIGPIVLTIPALYTYT